MKYNHLSSSQKKLKDLSRRLEQILKNYDPTKMESVARLIKQIERLVHDLAGKLGVKRVRRLLGGVAFLFGLTSTTSAHAQSFKSPVENPFNIKVQANLYFGAPSFGDLDGDGDLDMLVGVYGDSSEMLYYENVGTKQAPSFSAPVSNPFGLDETTIKYIVFPELVDIDGDGDLDILVNDYEKVSFYENTGNKQNPSFANPVPNPFGIKTEPYTIKITLSDLDNDGDFDILAADYYGHFIFHKNTGTSKVPQFGSGTLNPFGLPAQTEDSTQFPTLSDIDGDGDFDLLSGTYGYGKFLYYENTGTKNNPQFAAPRENPFGLTSTYYMSLPAFADLDNDGDLDLMAGEYYGNMQYFENEGSVGIETYSSSTLKVFPNPTNGLLEIRTELTFEHVKVYDLLGNVLLESDDYLKTIDVSSFISGMYILEISNSEGILCRKRFQKY